MGAWLRQVRWMVFKDAVLTFFGITIVMYEVFGADPISIEAMIAGLAMSGIGASFHLGVLMSGFIGKSSSESSSSHGQLPSSSSGQEHTE